jgi:rhamnose utilization protein RhaD (predicted bifunctional aldolase and dehydrogenase)
MSDISADPEFQALRALSAGVERNRLRTQAAGGNTSIKRDGVMWIKVSGRQLADVVARIPGTSKLLRLSPEEAFELTNWEAEKYRQSLAARAAPS